MKFRRRGGKPDANQAEIVKALRSLPNTKVWITSDLGYGFPDLIVGRPEGNMLLEVKDPAKVPSARKLKPLEEEFFRDWPGPKAVVHSIDEALAAIAYPVPWRAA